MDKPILTEGELLISRIIGVFLITFSLYLLNQAYINFKKK